MLGLGVVVLLAGVFTTGISAAVLIGLLREPARRFARMPRARVAEAPSGTSVILRGRVVGEVDEPATAPFSGSPAAWFEIRIDTSGPTRWHHAVFATSPHPVALDDGSGARLHVDPASLPIEDVDEEIALFDSLREAPARIAAFVGGRGLALTPPLKLRRGQVGFRAVERRIAPGETLTVVGVVAPPKPGDVSGYRAAPVRTLASASLLTKRELRAPTPLRGVIGCVVLGLAALVLGTGLMLGS